jgi:anaerobic selenocysteine-containing dehydrogenase
MADVLLPECTDIESTQLIRIGGSKFIEQFWDHEGFALRQPAVKPAGQTRDFTDIATELAVRAGLLEKYNEAINRGAACVRLSASTGTSSSIREAHDAADDLGPHLPRRQRRADRRQGERTAWTGSRSTACARGRSRACPGISSPS